VTVLRLRLTIAKINLIYRDDEPGRLLTLAAIEVALEEMFAEMPDDESEADD
jgi:hypothetical protein